jgi:outer membrane protein OmpA-like peptidoglycan-associated protein
MLVAAGWLLAGCSTLSAMNPVNWWHREQGGKIAQERPTPPGADQPYPNISTVPPKPEAPDPEALKKLTEALVADRTNAQHAAQSAPLADPSSPSASPSLFGVGTAPPPPPASVAPPPGSTSPAAASSTGAASASMPAATAPPPAPAPRKPVQSAPLDAPAPAPPSAASAAPNPPPAPPTAASAASNPASATPAAAPPAAQFPALPAAPPSRPAAAGTPPAPQAAPEPMPAPAAGASATIVFLEGASNLSQPATDEIKAFAAKRGNATVAVTGYGDAASSDPAAQSAALNLGLSRAQSIVEALKADGVPGNAIRVGAEASGRGASLHLLQ